MPDRRQLRSAPMSTRRRLRRAAHQLRLRERLDGGLDRIRLVIDGTVGAYQPQDHLEGRRTGARDEATHARWAAMEPVVREVGATSALDIGCNVGWFVTKLARLGMPVVGVEGRPATYRSALYARDRAGVDDVGILAMTVTPRTVRVLPHADCVLLLSVWHHMIDSHGLASARELLAAIWQHTGKVLFFENGVVDVAGRAEVDQLEGDAQDWFTELLGTTCEGGVVRHLGQHEALDARRHLFAVVRSGGGPPSPER